MSEDEGCICKRGWPFCQRAARCWAVQCKSRLTRTRDPAGETRSNRRIEPEEGGQRDLLAEVRAWPATACRPLQVPGSHGRTARSTGVQLACGTLTVLPPRNAPQASREPLQVWAIRVWEDPLEWILLTSVPTTTLEQGCRARGVL
jgi:hypothetical protein